MPEQQSERAMTTHVVIDVEPDPARPLHIKFEMNDDGACPAGFTLARAIEAAYPPGTLELVFLDLLAHLVISDNYLHAIEGLDSDDVPGLDLMRERLVKIANYWDRRRSDAYRAYHAQRAPAAEPPQPEPDQPQPGQS